MVPGEMGVPRAIPRSATAAPNFFEPLNTKHLKERNQFPVKNVRLDTTEVEVHAFCVLETRSRR